MPSPKLVSAALATGLGLAAMTGLFSSASAQIIDPSTMHVGTGAGTLGATGNAGDPNQIPSSTTFDVFQQSNGGVDGTDPLLVILAVPNTSFAPGDPTAATLYRPYPTLNGAVTVDTTIDSYGLSGYTQGSLFTSGDIYSFLGGFSSDSNAIGALKNANNSFNIDNMNNAELAINHFNPGSYQVYIFEAETSILANDLVNFTGANLPLGTFISAFAEEASKCPGPHCDAVDVPFTEAGLTTVPGLPPGGGHQDVPEPASLVLLGSALAGLGFVGRRRRKL